MSEAEKEKNGYIQLLTRLEVGGKSNGDGFPRDGLGDREDFFGSEGYRQLISKLVDSLRQLY